MGFMTLDNFRTDLQSALGDRGIVNERLDRWINFGYLDICGSIDFEVLDEEDTTQSISTGANTANVPAGALIVKLVKDTTNDNLLGWIPKPEFHRLSASATGAPTKWTRHKNQIFVHPKPTATTAIRIIYKKPPTRLINATDVTVLPDVWDAAVFMLAVSYGMLALGEEQRAGVWLQRVVHYIQTRMTEERMHSGESGLGLSLPVVGQSMLAQQLAATKEGQ